MNYTHTDQRYKQEHNHNPCRMRTDITFGDIYTERQKNFSLLQSDIHWNPLRQNDSYLDTD